MTNNPLDKNSEKEVDEIVKMLDNLVAKGSDRINIKVKDTDCETSVKEEKFSGRCNACSE